MSEVLIIGDGRLAEDIAERIADAGYDSAAFLYSVEEGQAIAGLEGYLQGFPGPYNLIVEAIVGSKTEKEIAINIAARHKRPGALILTATLNASATEVGSWLGVGAGDVVGWAALPPVSEVVEVMVGARANPDALDGAKRFFESLNADPVVINDTVGGVLPRVVASLINGAAFALMENVASAEDIDEAMKLGTNYPMGPLEWADMIGLDQVVGILDALAHTFGRNKYRTAPNLLRLVQAGHYGERTGRGFYEH